jgi:hypothetical protein
MSIQNEEFDTSLHILTARTEEELTATLLAKKGISSDLKIKKGRTPLSQAAWYGNICMANSLAERIDIITDSTDHHNRTPLS